MKISKLIKTLTAARREFGDVPVVLLDSETGNWYMLEQVLNSIHTQHQTGA